MTLFFQVSEFLCVAWEKELCQPVPFCFVCVGRKRLFHHPSNLWIGTILKQTSNRKTCERINCFTIPPTYESWKNGSLRSGCTWVEQTPSTVGSGKVNLAVAHTKNAVFFQWSWMPFLLFTVQRPLSSMPFNGTVQWHISKLTAVKTGEKRQIIPPHKFQSFSWVWGRIQFLRFHLFFLEKRFRKGKESFF